ncbi:hypothetical protein RRG08_065683 [Elysia crispata]|uniref:Uncharacterized protein n=1 Tax=Elysia crispata TaxID=231223 RepID=A0AAE0Y555_9GAST|nr:hypothetical protein RRG08_065683 [Elysia crispata]
MIVRSEDEPRQYSGGVQNINKAFPCTCANVRTASVAVSSSRSGSHDIGVMTSLPKRRSLDSTVIPGCRQPAQQISDYNLNLSGGGSSRHTSAGRYTDLGNYAARSVNHNGAQIVISRGTPI